MRIKSILENCKRHKDLRSKIKAQSSVKTLKEGGNMEGVSPIHIDEIGPTLTRLEKDTGLDLRNNTLGSVGKKEWSGDIDVAVNIPVDQFDELKRRLEKSPIVKEVKKGPLILMTKVEKQNHDPLRKKAGQHQTKYVQVDFMLSDDVDWLKTYYHAPRETESKYSGAHRNAAIRAISQFVDRKESAEKTPEGWPLEVERYKYSPTEGLVRVIRRPKLRKDGKGYTKSWTDEVVGGPWKNGDTIAKILKLGTAKDLNSFETIFNAVKKNHPNVLRHFAKALAADHTIENAIPDEIKDYL